VTAWKAKHELSHATSTMTAADIKIGDIAGRISIHHADL
jgi:hypothetical protein